MALSQGFILCNRDIVLRVIYIIRLVLVFRLDHSVGSHLLSLFEEVARVVDRIYFHSFVSNQFCCYSNVYYQTNGATPNKKYLKV